jgi:putative transposase
MMFKGHTVDFLLTKRRNKGSAQKFLNKAISNNGRPELINIDNSGANKQAIWVYNKRNFIRIKSRQVKYVNNIVEQDHRFIKWKVWPMLGFKSFESAQRTLAGIEIVRMIKKNQLENRIPAGNYILHRFQFVLNFATKATTHEKTKKFQQSSNPESFKWAT